MVDFGKLYVKTSEIGKETTFDMSLLKKTSNYHVFDVAGKGKETITLTIHASKAAKPAATRTRTKTRTRTRTRTKK